MDQLRTQRFNDRHIQDLLKNSGGRRAVGSTLPPEFARINTMIEVIQTAHLDGGDVSRDDLVEPRCRAC